MTRRPVQTKLYVHLSLADLAAHAAGIPAVGEVEKLGPATLDLIRAWLHDSKATIHPGPRPQQHRRRRPARPATADAGAGHPPRRPLRLPLVRTRRPASDLDHIEPYVPPDEGGPPGQTNPQGLAPLCRRHHRAKTFTGWTYERARDGTYTWTSPHGRTFTVGPHGTRRTSAPAPADRRPSRGVHPRHLTDGSRRTRVNRGVRSSPGACP